jgi:hypothetical protein
MNLEQTLDKVVEHAREEYHSGSRHMSADDRR